VTRYVGSEYGYDSDAADFEDSGTWTYVRSVGAYCWRPNVPPGWSPYALGTWRWTPAGLTWVSYETWGWLPYHYGTWAWDPDLGWYWIPGDLYAPAWVYWSYGPDWTGWCPVGWYGYYDNYYRSARLWYGNERGGPWLPNLRGRVEVTQIDRRGWNFSPTSRIGSRLDPARDVTRGDRVPFPRGQTVVVTTAPLRVERGAGAAASIQEAIRRASFPEAPGRGGANDGLASILRRDRVLDAAGQDELRRSIRSSRDVGIRTANSEPNRSRERAEAWRNAGERGLAGEGAPVRASSSRGDVGWRASSSVPPAPVEHREGERRDQHGDSGWHAPSPRVVERSSERPVSGRDDGARVEPRHEAPARQEPARSAPAPVYSGPSYSAPAYSAPAPAPAPPPAAAPAPAAPAQGPAARRDG
jgi:hypothetical protein